MSIRCNMPHNLFKKCVRVTYIIFVLIFVKLLLLLCITSILNNVGEFFIRNLRELFNYYEKVFQMCNFAAS